MLAMISQPMKGYTDTEVRVSRARASYWLVSHGYEVADTLFEAAPQGRNIGLAFLGKSIMAMSNCDVLYCVHGWQNARGCRVEHDAAREYGLTIFEEQLDGSVKEV